MACLYELQEIFKEVSGMHAVSLAPAAGAQGEFAGVAMIRAYHRARGDTARNEILIPDAGHGSNPASAVMCGYRVKEIPTGDDGDLNLAVLRNALGPRTAGIMLTNPSTLGLFDRNIQEIAAGVHDAGGLLYYDGGNLNAILGKVRPGDMGFDVIHINLHKTFSIPHGGGRPGARVRSGCRSAWSPICRCPWWPAMAPTTPGSTRAHARTASVISPPSAATPTSCCGPTSMPVCSAPQACNGGPNSLPSMPTICSGA